MTGDTAPRRPERRMPDGTPCWCVEAPAEQAGATWSHSPRCATIRALQGGYDFAEAGGAQGKRRSATQRTKKSAFLREFAQTGILTLSCEAVNVEPSTVYRWRDADPVFASMWTWAGEYAVDLMEQEARRRAVRGVPKGVYHQGEKIADEQQYSDTLLIFLLKGARPNKYRERLSVDIDIRKVAEEVAAASGGTASADAILVEAERILAEGRG